MLDLEAIQRAVENEVRSYRYEVPPNSLGTAWTAEKIEAELKLLRACVVRPYWVDVELRDTPEQIDARSMLLRRCAVVADDFMGTLVAFDPIANEFLLAVRQGGALCTIGVRGDVVGCFMSR